MFAPRTDESVLFAEPAATIDNIWRIAKKEEPMSDSAVRFGLIGFGAWGRRHAGAIAKTQGAELVAIAEPSAESREEARQAHPEADVVGDYREIAQRNDLDVVDVVVPNRIHHEVATAVLASGKHLLLEKPMCLTLEECDAVLEAAKRNNRLLSINHEFRLSSLWGKVKELVDAGLVGEPQYVRRHYLVLRFT